LGKVEITFFSRDASELVRATQIFLNFWIGASRARSATRGEWLDAVRVADELRHDDDAAEHEDAVRGCAGRGCRDRTKLASAQEPAKAAPKYFGADQYGGADER